METPQQPAQQPAPGEQDLPQHKKEKQPKKPSSYRISWPIVFILILLIAASVGAWAYFGNVRLQGVASSRDEDLKHRQAEIVVLNKDLDKARKELAELQTKNAAAATYITIPEWGVKFKPGTDLKDLIYFINGSTFDSSTVSLMKSASLANGQDSKKLFCSPYEAPLGAIVRYKDKTEVPTVGGPRTTKTVGNYIYGYTSPQSVCSSDKSTGDLGSVQSSALEKALDSFTLAN